MTFISAEEGIQCKFLWTDFLYKPFCSIGLASSTHSHIHWNRLSSAVRESKEPIGSSFHLTIGIQPILFNIGIFFNGIYKKSSMENFNPV